ncbi:hypothetical protein [Paenibacillus macerans]|uniref:hypothetical protein n=1 Tax=Paenibacillus macerans TaxID=44252 RepID=UPI0022E18755|nr:hypothetical protein [Paenibacillus macerans]
MVYRIINVAAVITVGVLGAILGGEYKNPVHLVGLLAIIIYAIIADFFIKEIEKKNAELDSQNALINNTQQELNDTKFKLSQILVQANKSGDNLMYMAIAPSTNGKIPNSTPVELQIVMNTPYSIQSPPDIRIITKKRWKSIKYNGNIIFATQYANSFEYTITRVHFTANLHNCLDKFFVYKLEIEFSSAGQYEFTIEAKSNDFNSAISNVFDVA